MVTTPAGGDSGVTTTNHATVGKQVAVMHQLTQLAGDVHRQRLAHTDRQRPAQRLRVLRRASRRADRARRRMRHAERQARRLRSQLGA
jgi:hypothetical protein